MSEGVIIALLGLGGSAIGTFGGIIASSKLTNYRIEQLEKKVDKHNTIIERTYILESKVEDLERRIENEENHN